MLVWYKVLTYGSLAFTGNDWRDPKDTPPRLYRTNMAPSVARTCRIPYGWNRDNIFIKSASVSF